MDRISSVILAYATRIAGVQESHALLQLNADMARDLVGADRCSIWLLDSTAGELWTTVAHGVGTIRIPAQHGLVGACLSQNARMVVNDPGAHPAFLQNVDVNTGYNTQNMLVIPLRGSNGAPVGALQALNKAGGFSDGDADLLALTAAYTSSTIEAQGLRVEAERARLLSHELEIAREVQSKLLPSSLQSIDAFELASFCRPARAVGGDYYDFIRMPSDCVGITLGDVSGKGIAAAVLMAGLQASLRTLMARIPVTLAELITDFNRAVCGWSMAGHYSTLFCGVFDRRNTTLTYVNAGHPTPLWIRAERSPLIKKLAAGGVPIGLLEDAEYESETVQLSQGDLIVAFSDGISEAENLAGQMWSQSEIEELVLGVSDRKPEAIVDELVRATDTYSTGLEQADDMTAVALRVR